MQFHTATIKSWKHLLKDDGYKDIVINCLEWLDANNRDTTHGFVIMPNHIHLLCTILETDKQHPAHTLASYTAHQFKKKLNSAAKIPVGRNVPLDIYISTQADRDYHFWERRPKTIDIKDRTMAVKTLEYIHNNPLQEQWKFAEFQEDYRYFSARFYITEQSEFKFIKHIADFL